MHMFHTSKSCTTPVLNLIQHHSFLRSRYISSPCSNVETVLSEEIIHCIEETEDYNKMKQPTFSLHQHRYISIVEMDTERIGDGLSLHFDDFPKII
jgi:hypothetical protein